VPVRLGIGRALTSVDALMSASSMVAAPLGAEERFLLVEAKLALQRTVVNLKEEGGLPY
jgi:hypothetical protein